MVNEAKIEDEILASGERLQLSQQSNLSGWGEGKKYQSKEVKKTKMFQGKWGNQQCKM